MKIITAIVRPELLDDLAQAVSGAGARGLTVTDVKGFGQQYGHLAHPVSAEQKALLLRKLRVDVLVSDESAEAVTQAIAKAVYTGAIGDGKIWVCPVDAAVRVRTGERDEQAA
jgi:nitrogen regulatory protein P-II 1